MGGCTSKTPAVPWSHRKTPDEFVEVSEEHGGHHTAMMIAMQTREKDVNIPTTIVEENSDSSRAAGGERVMSIEGGQHNQFEKKVYDSIAKQHVIPTDSSILGQLSQVQRVAYFHPKFEGDPFRILEFLGDEDLARLTQVNVQLHRVTEGFISIRNAKLNSKPADFNWHKLGSGAQALKFERFSQMLATLPQSTMREEFAEEIDAARFASQYESTSTPVLIRDLSDNWTAFNSPTTLWTFSNLLHRFPSTLFRFNDLHGEEIELRDYVAYARSTDDDSPLGLYDSQLGVEEDDPRAILLNEYENPQQVFGEDLFDLVVNTEQRPPFRWILLGPKRSGTGMHIDPLGTSAWVTVLSGRKLWIMFPPNTKENVGLHDDTTSWEWFSENFPACLQRIPGAMYVLQGSGETVFVPGGWLHAVVNLEETVAITHNYAPKANVQAILREVREKEPEFGALWEEKLRALSII